MFWEAAKLGPKPCGLIWRGQPVMKRRGSTGLLFLLCALIVTALLLLQTNIRRDDERSVLLFLKTHKCGSSTVQNIIMRYGGRRGLDFALPLKANYLGQGPFSPTFIPHHLRTADHKYDILAHHTRYSSRSVGEALRSGAARVTILREPSSLFESLYSFYHLERRNNNRSLSALLSSSEPHLNPRNSSYKFGLNQMSWDLGLDEQDFHSKDKVQQFLEVIEKDFDLVMISEYMEASLVLLAQLMRWPLGEVAFLTLNARTSRHPMTPEDKATLRKLNNVDEALYRRFLRLFRQKIMEYGFQRMTEDVARLMNINDRLKSNCVQGSTNKGYANTVGYKIKDSGDWVCQHAAKNELPFTEEIRQQQIARLAVLNNLRSFVRPD